MLGNKIVHKQNGNRYGVKFKQTLSLCLPFSPDDKITLTRVKATFLVWVFTDTTATEQCWNAMYFFIATAYFITSVLIFQSAHFTRSNRLIFHEVFATFFAHFVWVLVWKFHLKIKIRRELLASLRRNVGQISFTELSDLFILWHKEFDMSS